MKNPPSDPRLESLLHEELRKLPLHRAPESLVPRVIESIAAARGLKPWWRRAWWEWPAMARFGFAGLALALAGVAGGGGWWLHDAIFLEPALMVEHSPTFIDWKGDVVSWVSGFAAWWQLHGQQWLLPGLAAVGMAYLLCLAGGTMLVRMATNADNSRPRSRNHDRAALPFLFV